MAPSVLIVATLDTKGVEAHFVRTKLAACGVSTTLVDAGTLNPPHTPPDVGREVVLARAGTSMDELRASGDRATAVRAAATVSCWVCSGSEVRRAPPLLPKRCAPCPSAFPS